MKGVTAGKFAAFTGAGHISAKAARALLPGLARGMVYSEACAEVGYDHAARAVVTLDDIRNPVARKALGEMLKQVRAVVREYGLPDFIHVELARDVGKSAEERDKITHGIEDRNKEKDRRRAEFAELLGHDPDEAELLRYELWKEQNGRCLYSDEAIPPTALLATDNSVQVDHILPWSRFGDDSFVNKTLCRARANQEKKGRTPFEWFEQDRTQAEWEAFAARVDGCKGMRGRKKRGFYLRRNAAEVEEGFKARNLGDTRYATRVLLDLLKRLYPKDDRQHVLARPGALTAKLRRAWGLEDLKKDEAGKRRCRRPASCARRDRDRGDRRDDVAETDPGSTSSGTVGGSRAGSISPLSRSPGPGSGTRRGRRRSGCLSRARSGTGRVGRRTQQPSAKCGNATARPWSMSASGWRT